MPGNADLIECDGLSVVRRDGRTGRTVWDTARPSGRDGPLRNPGPWIREIHPDPPVVSLVDPPPDLNGDGVGDLVWVFHDRARAVRAVGEVWLLALELYRRAGGTRHASTRRPRPAARTEPGVSTVGAGSPMGPDRGTSRRYRRRRGWRLRSHHHRVILREPGGSRAAPRRGGPWRHPRWRRPALPRGHRGGFGPSRPMALDSSGRSRVPDLGIPGAAGRAGEGPPFVVDRVPGGAGMVRAGSLDGKPMRRSDSPGIRTRPRGSACRPRRRRRARDPGPGAGHLAPATELVGVLHRHRPDALDRDGGFRVHAGQREPSALPMAVAGRPRPQRPDRRGGPPLRLVSVGRHLPGPAAARRPDGTSPLGAANAPGDPGRGRTGPRGRGPRPGRRRHARACGRFDLRGSASASPDSGRRPRTGAPLRRTPSRGRTATRSGSGVATSRRIATAMRGRSCGGAAAPTAGRSWRYPSAD